MYIYENKNWTNFLWDSNLVTTKLGEARNLQGKIIAKMQSFGFDIQEEASLETLTQNIVKSSEIEGEFLAQQQVRSSIAQKLGLNIAGIIRAERHIDGIVEMMLDATQKYNEPLTKQRVFGWHSILFPTGWSNSYRITVADWRKDTTGKMQVVSGAMGKEKIHFVAPKASMIESEMKAFLQWMKSENSIDLLLKAGIAHLWFVTIHPFDDGNGRIARAITDMLLAKSDQIDKRFYSLSAQIQKERKQYYSILEKTQKGNSDITEWLLWFLQCFINAINSSEATLKKIMQKAEFWKLHSNLVLNQRQKTMLNKLLEEFKGILTTQKWSKMNKCSQDTALRDIQDLIKKDILQKLPSGGRSTSYWLKN